MTDFEQVIERVKQQAKDQNLSFNEYVESLVFKRFGEQKGNQIIKMCKFLANRGISSIEHGDKIICLNCDKEILVNEKTFMLGVDGEYIVCPHCNSGYDVQIYHLFGEKIKND
jgi:DNA-directed RNA polymerase subunit RPC12/RpoP